VTTSVAHLYNLRQRVSYQHQRQVWTMTRRTCVPFGERRAQGPINGPATCAWIAFIGRSGRTEGISRCCMEAAWNRRLYVLIPTMAQLSPRSGEVLHPRLPPTVRDSLRDSGNRFVRGVLNMFSALFSHLSFRTYRYGRLGLSNVLFWLGECSIMFTRDIFSVF